MPNIQRTNFHPRALSKGKYCSKVVDWNEIPTFVEKEGVVIGGVWKNHEEVEERKIRRGK